MRQWLQHGFLSNLQTMWLSFQVLVIFKPIIKKLVISKKIVSNIMKFNLNFHGIQSIQIIAHYKHFKV
jgi:hypothetical protein